MNPFVKIILGILLICLKNVSGLTLPPIWSKTNQINSGEFKAITMYTNKTAGTYTAGMTYNSSFTSFPRLILGLEGYHQNTPSTFTTNIGFHINITSITATLFSCSYKVYGSNITFLYYNYLAISANSPILLHTSYVFNPFTSGNLVNSSASSRSFTQVVSNNLGETYNINNQIIMQAYLAGFSCQQKNAGVNIKISISILNGTYHQVTYSTVGDTIITQVTYYRLAFDLTAINEGSGFLNIINVGGFQGANSTEKPVIGTFSLASFQYRNFLMGWFQIEITGFAVVDFLFQLIPGNSQIIYNSAPYYHLVSSFFHHKIRTCNSTTPFYLHAVQQCYDLCPPYYYTNTTTGYCKSCHYSCQLCNNSSDVVQCNQCQSIMGRIMSPANSSIGSCICIDGKYDNSVVLCANCSPRCFTCSMASTNCTSCIGLRELINFQCLCKLGYYDDNSFNGSCVLCKKGCLNCTLTTVTNVQICFQCNTTQFWTLNNASCVCIVGYFYNSASLLCQPCHYTCQTCSNSTACLSCLSSNFRSLNNSSKACECLSGYYGINNVKICSKCSTECLTCINSSNLCTSCNSLIRQLQNETCICLGKTIDAGLGLCKGSVCGDGILETDEECDDANVINGDGCSSVCKIQQTHLCVEGVKNISLCYYAGNVTFFIQQIYKYPYKNSVLLKFKITAPNCNRQNLLKYLQSAKKNARLLQSSISSLSLSVQPTKISQISYEKIYDILEIVADYFADVDFNGAELLLSPSNSYTLNYVTYFYSSPPAKTVLQTPYNNLPTKFVNSTQLNALQSLSYVYIVLVVLYLLFLILMIIFRKTPVAIQTLYVIYIAYYGLLAMKTVLPSLAGLGQYGKYLSGFSYPFGTVISYCPKANAIRFYCNSFYNLNIFIWIAIIFLIGYFGCFLFIFIKKWKLSQQQQTEKTMVQFQQLESKIKIAKKILFQLALTMSYMSATALTVSLSFQKSDEIIGSIISILLTTVLLIVVWVIWFRAAISEDQIQKNFVYFEIVPFTQISSVNGLYYPIMFIIFLFYGPLFSLAGVYAPFAIVSVIAIAYFVIICVFNIYSLKIHSIRMICNQILVLIICIMYVVSSVIEINSGIIIGAIICCILFITLLMNVLIILWIKFRIEKYTQKYNHDNKESQKDQNIQLQSSRKPLVTQLTPMTPTNDVLRAMKEQINWKEQIKDKTIELKQIKRKIQQTERTQLKDSLARQNYLLGNLGQNTALAEFQYQYQI